MTSRLKYYCCVPQCNNNYIHKSLSMHRFPLDKKLAKHWLIVLKVGRPLTKHMKVCSQHFLPSDYMKITPNPLRRHLKKGVIPSQKIPQVSGRPTSRRKKLLEDDVHTTRIHVKEEESNAIVDAAPSCSYPSYGKLKKHGPFEEDNKSRLFKDMSRCIVTNCKRLTDNFNLPAFKPRRSVWLLRSGNVNLVNSSKESCLNKKICRLHFHKRCFLKEDKLQMWAVPSLNLPDYIPTGGDEDTCLFIAKPRKTPKEKKWKRSSYFVENSPVRKVRTPGRMYEHQNIVHETLHIKDEIIYPVPLEYTKDKGEDLQTPSASTCQENIKIPLFQGGEIKKETVYSEHSYCIMQEAELELNRIEIKQKPFENVFINEMEELEPASRLEIELDPLETTYNKEEFDF